MTLIYLLLLIFLLPVLITIILLPFQFTITSLFNIFTVPGQIIKIAFNRQLRRNHALEHATINVIEEYRGPSQLAGLAQQNGFIIKGAAPLELIEQAAKVGLSRLKQGQKQLAIHRRCGTSMAVSNFIASLIFLLMLYKTGHFSFWSVLFALVIANMIGPAMGQFVQRFLTTATDVTDLEIVGVEYQDRRQVGFFGFSVPVMPNEFFIRTRKISYYGG